MDTKKGPSSGRVRRFLNVTGSIVRAIWNTAETCSFCCGIRFDREKRDNDMLTPQQLLRRACIGQELSSSDRTEKVAMSQTSCGCSSAKCQISLAPAGTEPIAGSLTTEIAWRDVLGGWKVRWGIGRMHYRVAPGLYRVGQPNADSPVLVTANYKLTVDRVRKELGGMDIWLLVLDTNGVNVWCAAGRGTFGTDELVRSVQGVNLKEMVKHRKLVLPQLGATGVAAHEVKRTTGFSVHYGPVRARDIKGYLGAGMKATPAMRRVTFNWKERLVLTPVEMVGGMKWAFVAAAVLAILDVIRHHRVTPQFSADIVPFVAAVLTGGVLVPLFLPLLPFRAFALKGAVAGIVLALALSFLLPMGGVTEAAGVALLVMAITSYMAMMFTGSTTFTTLAGAKLEVRRALPPIMISAGMGAVLRLVAAFV